MGHEAELGVSPGPAQTDLDLQAHARVSGADQASEVSMGAGSVVSSHEVPRGARQVDSGMASWADIAVTGLGHTPVAG